MNKHYGQIIEYTVRKGGYSITDLASEMQVNRRTVYNYFQNAYLKYDVIYKIGLIIRHDFSKEFPELFTGEEFHVANLDNARVILRTQLTDESVWKDKYFTLLENYNLLLKTFHSNDQMNTQCVK